MQTNRLIASTLAAAVATAGMSAIAEAGTIRHDRSDNDYRTRANLFPSVGRLSLRGPASAWTCSGTLIGSNWLLTAAHCLEDQAANSQNVTTGSFFIGGNSYSVRGGVKYSGWLNNNRNPTAGADIGLLQLSSNVSNVTAASRFAGTNEALQVGTYVGFGNRGTGLTGQIAGTAGTKRAGENTIANGSVLDWSSNLLISDFSDPRIAGSNARNVEYSIAQGDSGGGLFINGRLAGVSTVVYNSNGNSMWSDYSDFSLATRVSSFNNWIQNVMSQGLVSPGITTAGNPTTTSTSNTLMAADISDSERLEDLLTIAIYEDIYSNSAKVPEPSTAVGLLSLGGLLGLLRRRK
ncbi:S1 family peptidase [Microcoleus sp. FACHB-68]|uniref:trypsin-like serine protease n=1 Tax=Microcoleus sp. FACHB-68 TaxID=2692826 RepID=UPI001686C40A|nr:S1 family peptidase [Microcoleus sp. FACHB-68]